MCLRRACGGAVRVIFSLGKLSCLALLWLWASGLAAVAHTEPRYYFDLQAAPMHQSLLQYSRITRHSVLYESRLLRHKTSPALQGHYTATAALEHLLQGSGLQARLMASGFSLQPLPQAAKRLGDTGQALQHYELALRRKLAMQLCGTGQHLPKQRIAIQIWIDEHARINPVRLYIAEGEAAEARIRQALTGLYIGQPPVTLNWPLTLLLHTEGASHLCHP